MPRPRPLHLHREVTRHGKVKWFYRVGKGPRTQIRGDYGSPEFMAAYQAAATGEALLKGPRAAGPAAGSLAWLIARYRDSAAWAQLSPATRRQRENIFRHVIEKAGDWPAAKVSRQMIAKGRDDRAKTPAAANNFLKSMRGLFKWALESDFVRIDPTLDVSAVSIKTAGFHVWTEDEIEKFEARWPVGTRERLALAVLLYTGLRRGDAARLGRQHIREGCFVLRTEKTNTPVVIPILQELKVIIDASSTGSLTLIATREGRPMTKESFGNWFREACKAAGVPGAAHGLRKAGATRAAENGATERELNAIFGWTGAKMATLYTQTADRARLAKGTMGKMARNETATSIPAPVSKVRAGDEK